MNSPEAHLDPPPLTVPSPPHLCTCSPPPPTTAAPFAHLSSAILGPHPSPTSYLNEWILSHPDHLPPACPPPPLQHCMLLPSLQLLSFLVYRPPPTASSHLQSHYLYADDEVTVIMRDCRGKHVWHLRQCLAKQGTVEEERKVEGDTQRPSSPEVNNHSHYSSPPTQPPDDRFLAAWQLCASSHAPSPPPPEPPTSSSTSSPSPAPAVASPSPSGLSNLRNAIVNAKSPFSSLSSTSSSSPSSSTPSIRHWKLLPPSFSLFDAARDSSAWLTAQEATPEHSQYSRSVQQQMQLIFSHLTSHPPSPTPAPFLPPPPSPPPPLLDGFPQLHALLHHLGFFSSLVPTSTPDPLMGGVHPTSPSLLLLHSSPALTSSLSQLDMTEDVRVYRVLVLQRTEEQQQDAQMIRNRISQVNGEAQGGDEESMSFDGFLQGLSSAPDEPHSQLQVLAPSRLCPVIGGVEGSGDGEVGMALMNHFLATTSVRVIWCEEDGDYIPPHKTRRRERRQRRLEREKREKEKESAPRDASGSERGASYQSPPSLSLVPSLPPSSSSLLPPSPSLIALVYVVITHQSDASYRIRVDCDHRLRNRRRDPHPILSRTVSHTSPGSRVPPPLARGNSLTNAHSPQGASPATSATMLKTLFKRLGRTGKREKRGGSTAIRGGDRGREDSISPPRREGGVLGKQRSPRKEKGVADDGRGPAERRRSRALFQSHPVLGRVWPPEEVWVRGEELVGKVREWVVGGMERVEAWREVRGEEKRRKERAMRWKGNKGRTGEWSGEEGEEAERVRVEGWDEGDASARVRSVRSRLLRQMVREHGELSSPAALLAACFGSPHSTAIGD